MIRVFTTEVCPKCQRLKLFLESQGIQYETLDMQSPEGMTELLYSGVFIYDAPVLQVDESFYATKQLFKGVDLLKEDILKFIHKNYMRYGGAA